MKSERSGLSESIGALGTVVAVTISWSLHKSILWAALHGIFGWIYVIYYAIVR